MHHVPGRTHPVEHLRTGLDERPQLLLRAALCRLGFATRGNVDEGHDGAVDAILHGAVGSEPHHEPLPGPAADLVLHRHEILQHPTGIRLDPVILQTVREIGDRTPDIGFRDVEEFRDRWREHLDAQVGIEEQSADFRRVGEILQVAMRHRDAGQLALHLGIDGVKLLVDRLELLFRGLELLCRRAILLVDRLQLLVGGTKILDRRFVPAAAGDQGFLGSPQLGMKAANLVGLGVGCGL